MPNEYILKKSGTGMHYIKLDNETFKTLTKNNNKRVICRLNAQLDIHCAIMFKKETGHVIQIGSAICKKLGIRDGSKITAVLSIDDSEYQFDFPEELQEVLLTDPEAFEIFQSLTKGNQRSLIYLVNQVKSSDKRIERALKIVENLKNGITSARVILK